MSKKRETKLAAMFSKPVNLAKAKFQTMNKNKRLYYFVFLGICVVSLILCLWGIIAVSIEQQAQLNKLLTLRENGTLFSEYPALAPGIGDKPAGAWYSKGIEAFSWYLTSASPYGAVVYYFAVIFGLITTPLLIYYCSSFLIVCFPRKDKQLKTKKHNKHKKVVVMED